MTTAVVATGCEGYPFRSSGDRHPASRARTSTPSNESDPDEDVRDMLTDAVARVAGRPVHHMDLGALAVEHDVVDIAAEVVQAGEPEHIDIGTDITLKVRADEDWGRPGASEGRGSSDAVVEGQRHLADRRTSPDERITARGKAGGGGTCGPDAYGGCRSRPVQRTAGWTISRRRRR